MDNNALQNVVDEIKDYFDIVGGIRHFGGAELKESGRRYVGWHTAHDSESKASLHVYPESDSYHCYNCGQGCDIIDWVGHLQHGTAWHSQGDMFVDVLHEMATAAGVAWPDLSPEAAQEITERRQFWDILMLAANFYHSQLPTERRQFLHDRYGLTDETIDALKLGWAMPAQNSLVVNLREKGLSTDDILSTGLVRKRKDDQLQDLFQGRLVFPYWKGGRVVYFIARMTDASPQWERDKGGMKYVKQMTDRRKFPYLSPYSNNEHLYYSDAARNTNTILLTEGITDCIIANQEGFPCVSPATVRFRNADHARLAKVVERIPTIYIANDNEDSEAGRKGAMDTARYLWEQGKDPLLVTLPRPNGVDKIDLNDYLRERGAENFTGVLSQSVNLLDLAIDGITAVPEGRDRDTAIEHDLLPLLARHYSRVSWNRYKVVVKDRLGINHTTLDNLVKNLSDDGHSPKQAQKQKKERPSAWPYDVRDGRIVYLVETLDHAGNFTVRVQLIADFEARIASEITNENQTRTFVVVGKALRGGLFRTEMDAEDFGNDRKLKAVLDAASGARDPVRAGMGKHLSPALQLLTGDDITQLKRYQHTGWVDGHFLIPGREPDGVLVELPRKPPFRIDEKADLLLGLEALESLLKSMTPERATVVAALMFQAPLSKIAQWDNERYAIFIAGRTGSFKTSFAQVLMCIYGARFIDDELLIKWGEGATVNALMGTATKANDMPLLIDNFKPSTGGGTRAFIGLIHNILEGGEKDRLNRSSQLRETKPIFCWPLCTGEDVPDSDPSSLARILVVPFFWQEKRDNPELSRAQELSGHLSAVGDAWLSWLETQESQKIIVEIAAKFPQYRADWVGTLSALRGDSVNRRRVASNLATNQLTWEIVCRHPTIGPLAKKYQTQHLAGLTNIVALAMAEATSEALEASRYLAAIRELVATETAIIANMNTVILNELKSRVIGYKDEDGIYLLPKTARRAVEHLLNDDLNGISQAVLHKQLEGRRKIASHGKGTLLKTKRIDGKVIRVLHLKANALELEESSKPNEPVVAPQPQPLEIIPF